jgi:hypothetical protein
VIANVIEIVVPRENSDSGVAADQRAEDVRLGSEVEDGNLYTALWVEGIRLESGNLRDEILLGRIPVFMLGRRREDCICAHGNSSESCALVTEKRGDSTGVYASDSRNVISFAPGIQRLNHFVVRRFVREVLDNDRGTLNTT